MVSEIDGLLLITFLNPWHQRLSCGNWGLRQTFIVSTCIPPAPSPHPLKGLLVLVWDFSVWWIRSKWLINSVCGSSSEHSICISEIFPRLNRPGPNCGINLGRKKTAYVLTSQQWWRDLRRALGFSQWSIGQDVDIWVISLGGLRQGEKWDHIVSFPGVTSWDQWLPKGPCLFRPESPHAPQGPWARVSLHSGVKLQLPKEGRQSTLTPPSMCPPACDHLLGTPDQSNCSSFIIRSLHIGEGQGEDQRVWESGQRWPLKGHGWEYSVWN